MIPELGFFALCVALAASVGTLLTGVTAVATKERYLLSLTFPMAQLIFFSVLASYLILSYSFYTSDFSVQYVANHGSTLMPWYYRITAVWGAHEGSMLLWVLIQSAWIYAVSIWSKTLPLITRVRLLAVLAAVSIGFVAFTLFASNPFERSFPFVPAEGGDLNPLLQDFGMIIHPPMLYMGYVGMSVAFCLAIVALIEGRIDSQWARWTRNWTMVAWCFLTIGIALGSWWAYYELGWGGWWFWDPVENASFMPWLIATALIHSLIVAEKRGAFNQWTILLCITGFSLSLLGTFLVRSGVITSVHAFASDPERGLFILKFLGIAIGCSLALFAWRAPNLRNLSEHNALSREGLLLVNNIVLVLSMSIVLFGTLYPLIHDALGLGKVSVGPPYFNLFFVPLMLILGLVLVAGPLANFKRNQPSKLGGLLKLQLIAAIVVGAIVWWIAGVWVAVTAAIFAALVGTLFIDIRRKLRNKGVSFSSLVSIGPAVWAMHIAHLGFGLCLLAVAITVEHSYETSIRISQGETVEVQGYNVTLERLENLEGSNWVSIAGVFRVSQDGSTVATLMPEKRNYITRQQIMTESAIDWGLDRDLYMAMGEDLGDGSWSVRVQIKPGVRLIWVSAAIMAFAGFLSMRARRSKARIRASVTTQGATA